MALRPAAEVAVEIDTMLTMNDPNKATAIIEADRRATVTAIGSIIATRKRNIITAQDNVWLMEQIEAILKEA